MINLHVKLIIKIIKLKRKIIINTPMAATKVNINDMITIIVAIIRVEANIFCNWLNGPIRKHVL